MVEKRMAGLGLLLFVDFLISVVMLATDKNLQTDFGSVAPYYLHWYGVLAMAIVDLLAALTLLSFAAVPMLRGRAPSFQRVAVVGGLVWSVLAMLAMVGIVETYQQVGFPSANAFATYLFGVTPYPDALSYIPWLYDLLLVAYLLTAVVGVWAVWRGRSAPASSASSSTA
jgi:hypothetical protein